MLILTVLDILRKLTLAILCESVDEDFDGETGLDSDGFQGLSILPIFNFYTRPTKLIAKKQFLHK